MFANAMKDDMLVFTDERKGRLWDMSLGVAIKGPEGIVLAADSRVTLTAQSTEEGARPITVNFDTATKVLTFGKPNVAVGVVTYGLAAIGTHAFRTAHSFVPEFEVGLRDERLSVKDFSKKLSEFFMDQWRAAMPEDYAGPNMAFLVGGFDENEPYGRIFEIGIPKNPNPKEWHSGLQFGIVWGGQREFVERLVQGYDRRLPDIARKALNLNDEQTKTFVEALRPLGIGIPYQFLPLQDCVNLAIFLIRTTITAQELTIGVRGVGGPIDVATITRREGLNPVQQKKIVGEFDSRKGGAL